MNKRIQELAEQAEDEVVADHRGDAFHKAFTEKFAELIVKDSVQMFAENGYDESCDMLIEHWNMDPRTFRS